MGFLDNAIGRVVKGEAIRLLPHFFDTNSDLSIMKETANQAFIVEPQQYRKLGER
jgi:hypothetical protein